MANRYPLILNAAAGQLQELPTGDSLDLGGEGVLGVKLGSAAVPSISFTGGDTNTGIYSPGADQLAISTGGTGRLFVGSDGRVIAGGDGTIGGTAILGAIGSTSGSIFGGTLALVQGRTPPNGSTLGVIEFGSETNPASAGINSSAVGTWTEGSSQGSDLQFLTTNTGSASATERLRITAAGLLGIGTSSPNATLEVVGQIFSNVTGTNQYVLNTGGSGFGFIMNPSAGKWSLGYGSTVGTLGTSVLTWTTGGLVGIGTTAPGASLTIVADSSTNGIDILGRSSDNQSRIRFTNNAYNAVYGQITHDATNLSINNVLSGAVVLSSANTERLRITSAGLVGVGTSAPRSRLDVRQSADGTFSGLTVGASGSDKFIGIGYNAATTSWNIHPTFDSAGGYSPLAFNVGGGEAVRIDTSQRVGIGTTTPSALTHLNVSSADSYTPLSAPVGITASDVLFLYNTDQTTDGYVGIFFQHKTSNTAWGRIALQGNFYGAPQHAFVFTMRGGSGLSNNEKFRIGNDGTISFNGDTTSFIGGGSSTLTFTTNSAERARIDSSGRLLIGTSTAPAGGNGNISKVVIQGYVGNDIGVGIISLQRGQAASALSTGTELGRIAFNDNGGNSFATITCDSDAASGTNDYPGRLVFSTTADGASSPTERMRITSAGKIGIGTSTPESKLTIDANFTGYNVPLDVRNSGSAHFYLGVAQTFSVNTGTVVEPVGRILATSSSWGYGTFGSNKFTIEGMKPGGIDIRSNIDAPITFSTGGTQDNSIERMRINSSGQILAGALGTASLPIISFLNDANTGIFSSAADTLDIATGATAKVRFDNTTAPLKEIYNGIYYPIATQTDIGTDANQIPLNAFLGTMAFQDSSQVAVGALYTTGDVKLDDGGVFVTTLQTITPTSNRTISFPNATGTVALVAGASGQLVWNSAGAYAGAPGSVIGTTGDLTLALNGAASTPPLKLTGTWFTGGSATTTKPQVLVEPAGTTSTAWSTAGTGLGVNAASGFAGRLMDLQLNGTSNFSVDSTGRVSVPLGTAALPSIYPGTDTNTGIYSPGADQLAVATNGTGRLFVDTNGNVTLPSGGNLGINGASPQSPLDVISNASGYGISLRGRSGDSLAQFRFTSNDHAATYAAVETAPTYLAAQVNGSERLRITSAGLVGIGTSIPQALLHISSVTTATERISGTAGNSDHTECANIDFQNNTSGSVVGRIRSLTGVGGIQSGKGQLAFFTHNGGSLLEQIRINEDGLVGIGTTSPTSSLHVKSTGNGSSFASSLELSDNSVNVNTLVIQQATGITRFLASWNGTGVDTNLTFWTTTSGGAQSERVRIDSSGKLLVGTSNQNSYFSSKVQVAGADSGATLLIDAYSANINPAALYLGKSRNATVGSYTILDPNDIIGKIDFYGSDNSGPVQAAAIACLVDGTPGANDMPGRLVFSTTPDSGSSPTSSPPAMTIKSSQEVLIGTSTITANGGVLQLKSGITFPATAVAATNANTLDDYEEGTWTAAITATGGGTQTYTMTASAASYTKIGNVVHLFGRLEWTYAAGGSPSSSCAINLPLSAGSTSYQYRASSFVGTSNTAGVILSRETSASASFFSNMSGGNAFFYFTYMIES